MTTSTEHHALIQQIRPGSRVIGTRSISNSDPQKMTAVEIQQAAGATETLVIRRHQPESLTQEARLLRLLRESDVPVPAVLHVQDDVMVQSYVAGESQFSPGDVTACVTTMAQMLARIHQADFADETADFLPDVRGRCQARIANRPETLQASMGEPEIRAVLERDWHTLTHHAPVLLHGDFWPGNVLWRDDVIIGVIDWEDALYGDPLADLGNSRREILWFFGKDAMQQFTEAYQAQMPHLTYRNLPYWDLCMALNPVGKVSSWCLDDAAKQRFRARQRWLVHTACDALANP